MNRNRPNLRTAPRGIKVLTLPEKGLALLPVEAIDCLNSYISPNQPLFGATRWTPEARCRFNTGAREVRSRLRVPPPPDMEGTPPAWRSGLGRSESF